MTKENNKKLPISIMVLALLMVTLSMVSGEPAGIAIDSNQTDPGLTIQPDNRTDPGGTITTLVLDALQQTNRWKAYVGNITGSLTLSDSTGSTIFSWTLEQSGITGEIYSSRSNNVAWGDIRCADTTVIDDEESFLGLTGSEAYSITETFNETIHEGLTIGPALIGSDTCFSTSTYVNDNPQPQASADFQLILLDDTIDLVYTTPISAETTGYDGSLFDFQLIVPNNPQDTTTYYFYAQIGG